MNLWALSCLSTIGVKMATSGCTRSRSATPSGAETMQIMLMAVAPVALIKSMAAAALPPVASIGSIIRT